MVWSAYMGLPLSLESVGAVLGPEQQKIREGKDLIRFFSKPCRPTAKSEDKTQNLWYHDKKKWDTFKAYNKRDVETEMGMQQRLRKFPIPDMLSELVRTAFVPQNDRKFIVADFSAI